MSRSEWKYAGSSPHGYGSQGRAFRAAPLHPTITSPPYPPRLGKRSAAFKLQAAPRHFLKGGNDFIPLSGCLFQIVHGVHHPCCDGDLPIVTGVIWRYIIESGDGFHLHPVGNHQPICTPWRLKPQILICMCCNLPVQRKMYRAVTLANKLRRYITDTSLGLLLRGY